MYRLRPEDYTETLSKIDKTGCGAIYPISIAEDYQKGEIYSFGESLLFHHYSGFAFLYGSYDEAVLQSIYDSFLSPQSTPPRRFVPFVTDEKAKNFFASKEGLALDTRYFFEYRKGTAPTVRTLPDGMTIREIDSSLFDRIQGRITPWFSWDSKEEFLKKGKGYAVVDGENAAAWAFSAAVSDDETDIGVETAESFRGRGLATAAAESMIRYILGQNKLPVWACHAANEGSQRLALKVGFEKTAECIAVRKL